MLVLLKAISVNEYQILGTYNLNCEFVNSNQSNKV